MFGLMFFISSNCLLLNNCPQYYNYDINASPVTGFPQVLESPGKSSNLKCPRNSWKVLGFLNFYEKSWESSEILHNIFPMNFLFQNSF